MSTTSQPSRGRAAIAALIVVLVVFGVSFGVRKATASSAQAAPLPAPMVVSSTPVHVSGYRNARHAAGAASSAAFNRSRSGFHSHAGEHSPSGHDPGIDFDPNSHSQHALQILHSERRQRQWPGARGLVSKRAGLPIDEQRLVMMVNPVNPLGLRCRRATSGLA